MKKHLLIVLLTCLAVNCLAQDKKEQYCRIVVYNQFSVKGTVIDIDSGQVTKSYSNLERVADEKGKYVKFNSIIDAFNYLGGKGWKFIDAYPIETANLSLERYSYFFKREVVISPQLSEMSMNSLQRDSTHNEK